VDLKLKNISKDAAPGAIAKAEVYRHLNEPGEAESICRDVLAVDPDHQQALRHLGLALTEQFTGGEADRYVEAERAFQSLKDPYERVYYTGLLRERRAKAELRAGHKPYHVFALLQDALRCFEEAEKIRPPGNDESILRWNRCVRLIQSSPELEWTLRKSKG
jgi:tetratricopeptide (TPR) repeat protein